jgi:hypothetical protein
MINDKNNKKTFAELQKQVDKSVGEFVDTVSKYNDYEESIPTFGELVSDAKGLATYATDLAEMVSAREAQQSLHALRMLENNIRNFRRKFNRLTELRFKELAN